MKWSVKLRNVMKKCPNIAHLAKLKDFQGIKPLDPLINFMITNGRQKRDSEIHIFSDYTTKVCLIWICTGYYKHFRLKQEGTVILPSENLATE